MCGITGWVDWTKNLENERDVTARMTDALWRRGPDERGEWVSRHTFLGHRRLSIIDLAAGQQPMTAAAPEPIALSYSGEVYNFQELRAELEGMGHAFRTRSDTEVVLRAYIQWGADSFERLRGIYAFAIWDGNTDQLWLVRDRFGVKPLYYYPAAGGVLFGSEPKAIFANPAVRPKLGISGIGELFALASAPTPGHGVYEGLHQVKPGHAVVLGRSGLREHRYWTLTARRHDDDAGETASRVRHLLHEIVEQQLVSDVALGSLLSGGLDSTIIASFASRSLGASGQRLPTYSVDFPSDGTAFAATPWQSSEDEPFAQEAARYIGSDHQTILVPPGDVIGSLDDVLAFRDGPAWGDLDSSLYILCRHVRERTTVALSGEAADEVFGGYPFFHEPAAVAGEGFPWLHGKQGFWTLLRGDVARKVEPEAYIDQRFREARAQVPHLDGESKEERRIREITHISLTRWLPAMLDRKDRMSMAASLEVRVPFCDHKLVEYVWNVPWSIRARGGTGKALLRDAARDIIPRSILERRKSGFPANGAAEYMNRLVGEAETLLDRAEAPIFQLLSREKVRAAIANPSRFPSPRAANNGAIGLSYLLSTNRWMESYDVAVAL